MSIKKTFLIVDDDADDCEFFCEAVSEIDASVKCITIHSGEDALQKLRTGIKQLPDFIFLDLNMPRMNGRQCLIELKKDTRLKNIPVIIYSTSSAQKDIDETRQLGAAYFLTKPSDFQKLRKEIIFVLKKEWSHQQKERAV
ncbi:MAG: response regulator [Parafilimonas sp.]